jgi:hypothetical protein
MLCLETVVIVSKFVTMCPNTPMLPPLKSAQVKFKAIRAFTPNIALDTFDINQSHDQSTKTVDLLIDWLASQAQSCPRREPDAMKARPNYTT